jgi:hypothetical protein
MSELQAEQLGAIATTHPAGLLAQHMLGTVPLTDMQH